MKIEIYSRPGCIYCTKAKDLLKRKGFVYTEYNIDGVTVTKKSIEERIGDGTTKVNTIPQIFFDDKHIGGYVELVEHFANL